MKTKTVAASLVTILAISCLAVGLSAATLKLKNGDCLTGEVLEEQGDTLRFRSTVFGEVAVGKDQVANLEELLGAVMTAENVAAVSTELEGKSEPIALSSTVSESTEVESKSVWQRLRENLPFADWDKRLQFGLTTLSGRKDKTDSNWRLTMSRKREKQRFNFDAKSYYGETNGDKTSDKFESKLRWRRDLSPGVFYQSETVYLSDEIKSIDMNFEQKLGLGFRFLDSETVKMSTGAGTSARWRTFSSDKLDESDYLMDLFQDWNYRLSEKMRFKQDFRVAMPLEKSDEYEYKFSAALVSEVTKSINLSLRYELGYDNSLETEDREDRRFISTMGYTF